MVSHNTFNTKQNRAAQRTVILAIVTEMGKTGATTFFVEESLGWSHQTVSAHLSNLEKDGLLCRNGEQRLSPSHTPCMVYFDPRFVPVADRLPVVRKGAVLFEWRELEERRLDALCASVERAIFAGR